MLARPSPFFRRSDKHKAKAEDSLELLWQLCASKVCGDLFTKATPAVDITRFRVHAPEVLEVVEIR